MTEKWSRKEIRNELHMTDMEIVKIIIRFAIWHNHFNYTAPTNIAYFFSKYIKTADTFERMCLFVPRFNLYIPGFINYCQFLGIPHPPQKTLYRSKQELLGLEQPLDEVIDRIGKYFAKNDLPVSFSAVFYFIVHNGCSFPMP